MVMKVMKLRLVFIFVSPDRDEVIVQGLMALFRGTGPPEMQEMPQNLGIRQEILQGFTEIWVQQLLQQPPPQTNHNHHYHHRCSENQNSQKINNRECFFCVLVYKEQGELQLA